MIGTDNKNSIAVAIINPNSFYSPYPSGQQSWQ